MTTTTFSVHKAIERNGAPVSSEIIAAGLRTDHDAINVMHDLAQAAQAAGARIFWRRDVGRVTVSTEAKPGLSSAPDVQVIYQVVADAVA